MRPKREIVERALLNNPDRSDEVIASQVGATRPTVIKYRKALGLHWRKETKGIDGVIRKMPIKAKTSQPNLKKQLADHVAKLEWIARYLDAGSRETRNATKRAFSRLEKAFQRHLQRENRSD